MKFKLVIAGQWADDECMSHIIFSKNCANTETYSFADMYATRMLYEGNYHSSPALL